MRRTLVIATVAAAALTTAGLAVATLNSAGVKAATATFTAAKERSETRTCTGDGNAYEITTGRYAGSIDFADPNNELDGPVTIWTRAVVNKTAGVGYLDGWFRVKDNDRRPQGRFVATLDGSGNVDGFVQGRVNRHYALLLGSVSAKFSPDGGFTEGKLGNGSTSLPAVLVGRPCKDSKPGPVAVRLSVKGEVSELTDSSITVSPRDGSAAQTCKLAAGRSPSTQGIAKGSKVEIACGLVGGEMTLLKLKKHD